MKMGYPSPAEPRVHFYAKEDGFFFHGYQGKIVTTTPAGTHVDRVVGANWPEFRSRALAELMHARKMAGWVDVGPATLVIEQKPYKAGHALPEAKRRELEAVGAAVFA